MTENVSTRKKIARLGIWKSQVIAHGLQVGTGKKYIWGELDEKIYQAIRADIEGKEDKR